MFGWLFKKPSEIREDLRRKREEERQRRAAEAKPRSYDALTGLPVETDTDANFAMAAAMGGQVYYESVVVPALADAPAVDVSSPTTAPSTACVASDTTMVCTDVPASTTDYTSPPPPPPATTDYTSPPPPSYDYSSPPPASYDYSSPPPASFDSW